MAATGNLSAAELLPYRRYHAERERRRRARREEDRLACLSALREAIRRHAPNFPAIKTVTFFGSLLREGQFSPSSDIDIAVDCDDFSSESAFARVLQEDLDARELRYEIELRPREQGLECILGLTGECAYEREIPGS